MLDGRTEVFEHLAFYMAEFARLNARRGVGINGPMPLGGQEIDRRAAHLGLEGGDAEWFAECIEHLDATFLGWSREQGAQSDDGRAVPSPHDRQHAGGRGRS